MGRIVRLDPDVANKIAAGEVVERPASVVKELVENSLDAGATRIAVHLVDGGKGLIRVVDDGHGMPADDAYSSVLPHATSKVRTVGDLAAIETLGFRGEALPSIASVSNFLLTTRPWDADEGTAVAIEGGREPRVEAVGCPPGTVVTVRDLFHNVPARLKFLRTTSTELARIVDLMGHFAFAHPHVGFTLAHGEKEVFRSNPSDHLKSKLADVLGRSKVDLMIPVEHETPLLTLRGFIARPELTMNSRAGHYLFVNRRAIRSAAISYAVEQAYGTLIPPRRRPVAVLLLSMDPRLVDPNVHPTKAEIRFARESEIFRTVMGAVRAALQANDLAPQPEMEAEVELRPSPAPASSGGAGPARQLSDTSLLEPARRPPSAEEMQPFRDALQARREEGTQSAPATPPAEDASAEPAPVQPQPLASPEAPGPALQVIGQALESYVLAEVDGDLCIVDQHAAHERVLFHRALSALKGKPMDSQGLLTPLTVELSAVEAAAAVEHEEALVQLGFRTEPFGGQSVLVRSVPAALRRGDPTLVLRDMLEALAGEGEFGRLPDPRERLAASMACTAAVKADEHLEDAEMRALIRDLLATPEHATCPHGRPTLLRFTPAKLGRQFGRT